MLAKEFKFKPFVSNSEKGISCKSTQLLIFEAHIKTVCFYAYETGEEERVDVDIISVFDRNQISALQYYYDSSMQGYFLCLSGCAYGFTDREEGLKVFNAIIEWKYYADKEH